ncbi:hypothetical protein LTR78_008239 [Recurvomyces mirabilis]|uniref:Heterokaryon incompatibility domain-containing protein n=1 Tax=Recurvomyces mirabilis TaxID=574656 RepID=A0AAE0TUX7_9PEZI|nr:hypothetical protein LTR78_008239 [Recurvomyces mirabilis]KAK5156524.1 hypothetical protein LTS14_004736 [Recurvomyces mirabilis]
MDEGSQEMPDFIVIPALCSRSRLGLGGTPSKDGGNERERKWALSYKPTQWQDLQYDELPSPNHIRLLQKHEKEDHRLFEYTLRTFHIDEAPLYTTLSYTWGSPYEATAKPDNNIGEEYDYHIIVNGQIHHASENLFLVCIDQADDKEKATQVARMGTIYAKAAGTYVWLGEQDAAAEVVYEIMETFVPAWLQACDEGRLSVSQIVTLGEEAAFWTIVGVPRWGDKQTDSIVQFFNRSWFERAWTIQELVLGKDFAVACGGLALNWLYFSALSHFLFRSGLYLAMQKVKNLSLAPQTVITFENESRIYELKQTTDTQAVGGIPMAYDKLRDACVEQYSRGLTSCPDGHIDTPDKERFYTMLASLVLFFRGARAARSVDKIFAPLAVAAQLLACEKRRHHYIKPDYGSPPVKTFVEATRTIIEHTRSSAILSHIEPWKSRTMHELPSWVPDFSSVIMGSMNLGDNGKSLLIKPTYNAMAGCSELFRAIAADRMLMVRGTIWQTMAENIPDRPDAYFNLRPLLYVKLAASVSTVHANGQKRAEVLWRTMICDCQDDVHPAPDLSRIFHDFFLAQILGNFDTQDDEELLAGSSSRSPDWPELDTLSKDAEMTIPGVQDVTRAARDSEHGVEQITDAEESIARAEVFPRLYQVARSKRRIFRTSDGALGHGAERLQGGDVVAFLVGATIPFILRPIDVDQYRLIGETYMHGYMHGEALRGSGLVFQDIGLV